MSQPIVSRGVPFVDLSRTGFSVQCETTAGVVVFRLRGELDMATAVDLRSRLAEELGKGPGAVAVDLTELSFVDSSGIGALLVASRRAQEAGCSFVLHSPGRAVRRALQLTGVDALLKIEDDPPRSFR